MEVEGHRYPVRRTRRRILGPEHKQTLASVKEGIALGIEKAPDLKSLRSDPRFGALVAHAEERAVAAQKKQ